MADNQRFSLLSEIRALLSTTYYTLRIHYSYAPNIAWLILLPIMYAFIGTVMSGLVDPSAVIPVEREPVTFLQFLLPGMVVWLFSSASLGLVGSVEAEIVWGTAQSAFSTPTRPTTFLLGLLLSAFLPSLLVTMVVVGYMSLVLGGVTLTPALVPFALGIGVYTGIGMLMSAVALRYRRVGNLVMLWTFVEQFLAGVILPISVIPMPVRLLSYMMPTTWVIDLVRAGLLGTATILPYKTQLSLLAGIAVLMLVLGSLAVHRALHRVAELGIGDTY
ncbi:MAG: hypothetical protein DDT34_02363 [Firmicutes bacterium]|nr:hypothetical protein [Bacillota bacterium]